MPLTPPVRDRGRSRARKLTRTFAVGASAGTLGVAALLAHHAPAKAAAGDPPSHRANSGSASSSDSGSDDSREEGGSSTPARPKPHRTQTFAGSTGSSGSGVTGSSGQPHATTSGS